MSKRTDSERTAFYQRRMETINSIRRDGDNFYHVTRKENVESLLAKGFDQERIGTEGGCQGGVGFSMCWCKSDAIEWGERLFGYGAELAILKVTLPGVKLATQQMCDEWKQEIILWSQDQGYIRPGKDGKYDITEKLEKLYDKAPSLASAGWAITGLYAQAQGYQGYMAGIDEVVIMDFAILTPTVFSRCS